MKIHVFEESGKSVVRGSVSYAELFPERCSSPEAADIVLLNAAGLDEGMALLSQVEVVHASKNGALIVDVSPVPWAVNPGARALTRALGIHLIDAMEVPSWVATEGSVRAVGADSALFERLRPVLSKLGQQPICAGPRGAGYGLRLALTALNCCILAALAEVIELADAEGVRPDDFYRMALVSRGNSAVLREVMPRRLAGKFDDGRVLKTVLDDLELFHGSSEAAVVPLAVCGAALQTLRLAHAITRGEAGVASVFKAIQLRSGKSALTCRSGELELPRPKNVTHRCGFIGLGLMGRPMALNLARALGRIVVYDVSPEACDRVAGIKGITVANSVADVAKECDAVFLSLPDHHAVEEVTLGGSGLLRSLAPGAFLIDATTSFPPLTRRLVKAGRDRGVSVIDAPVSGGPEGAEEASLSLMVGAEEDGLASVLPLLQIIGRNIFWAGPPGSGHSMKVMHTALNMTTLVAFSETAAVAARMGVASEVICSWISKLCPAGILESRMSRMLAREFNPGATIDIMHKDVYLAGAIASEHRFPFIVCEEARMTFQAARAGGLGREDIAAIMKVIERFTTSLHGG